MRRVVFTIGAKQLILGMCVVAMAIVFIPVLLDIPIVAGNIERAFDFEQGGLGYAGIARIRNYSYLIEFPLLFKFIGMGYGNVPVDTYLPSLAYTLYSSGLIGGLLVLCFFINMYRKTIHFQNVFVILYGILIIGSTAFFALNVCFYLPFLTYNSNRSDSFTEVQQAHGRTA
ncbi:MAG: hypothetical protein GX154_09105 [Clostridiales bacterium]|nr:hypothetical protein [Clostridiales bacterium]